MLRSAGADLLDQATSVAGALQLIALNTYDFALLDFKLGNDSSLEIAAELKTRGVPFAFATGFADGTALAPDYSDVLVVTKPFATDTLIEAVVALLKR